MKKRIALVEDEASIRDNYASVLQQKGYDVVAYGGKEEALRAFEARLPDLAILDIGLGEDPEAGFELCRYLRQRSETLPIVFLTALDGEFDTISGLRLGADDYLTKDISMAQVLVRVATLFRRVEAIARSSEGQSEVLQAGHLELDADRFTVKWRAKPVDITLTEFWLLYALARRPGHVKSREQLMEASKAVVDDSTITSHIKRIRKKFMHIDAEFDRIETVYGIGYRWKSN